MPRAAMTGRFQIDDLVLEVSKSVDRKKWDESKYEDFIDQLCDTREYQKEAIRAALRYLLGGEYESLRALALENFEANSVLKEKYGTFANMERSLQLPEFLAASIDLATGTGKSYVMYGIAAIMLAEGVVDRVLVLGPSTTIESGLTKKFEELASNQDLRDLLPNTAVVSTPRIINASESIVAGSICIENYHAVLAHVRSSVRDSLTGKGQRTLVLNDEAHHVANETGVAAGKWKGFLTDQSYGFKYIIGVSGTCYIKNEYFSDVIYRYSLREAMEDRFVKKVRYVAEMPQTNLPSEERWQLIINHHEEIRKTVKGHDIRPLSIVVTRDISSCEDVAEEFKRYLAEHTALTTEEVKEHVLVVHSKSADLMRLSMVDNPSSKVEWIFSVSMLNEGWDVKRVFQIVPHEKRAFESKLLISQVLGRGLRIPDGWKGQPEVTVFNHDRWSEDIKHLVNEVMDFDKRIPTSPVAGGDFNFDLVNIKYEPKAYFEQTIPRAAPYKIFEKGYVDMATEQGVEEVRVEFEDAATRSRTEWRTRVEHKTYTPGEIAQVMYERLEDLPDEEDRKFYTEQFSIDDLEKVVRLSMEKTKNKVITENMRQKFLSALGSLQRKATQMVRYDFTPQDYPVISTHERPQESASVSELKSTKTLFVTSDTESTIPDEYREAYKEVTEEGSGYRYITVPNKYDFKTSLNAVIADHDPERKFIKELINPDNLDSISAWIKSTPIGFYEIEYSWRKGDHPKRGRFSPDFFIKTGSQILVVETKGDEELRDHSPENPKKYEYAIKHFERLNEYLKSKGSDVRYQFNFLTPSDYSNYFQCLREGNIVGYRSQLDVRLSEAQ